MRFRATVELHGKTATGVQVPDEVVDGLGAGRHPPVRATINGHTYRSSIARMGGRFLLGINAGNRGAAGVAAGDEVEVDVEVDTEPREVAVPDDLAAALAADTAAHRFFETLSYSRKRRIVLPIEDARTPETRQRRIARSVADLRDGRA